MPAHLTLYGATPADVAADVYFRDDFLEMHARPHWIERLTRDGFRHAAVVRHVPGTSLTDLETPWGYGGPLAADTGAMRNGLNIWRARQASEGRVAEFVRLHPFLNPVALVGLVDDVRLDRLTVLVDLQATADVRWRQYSKGTRYSIRSALKTLRFRRLGASEGELFRRCYQAGLARNQASKDYYFAPDYFEALLAAPWCIAWVAERGDAPVAVASFLDGGALAHYHLSGGTEVARDTFAHYGLLHIAIDYFRSRGSRWLHLGGGRSSRLDDPLLAFKAKFSSHRIPYYTAGMVHDRLAFDGLPRRNNGRFLSYRFPEQRPEHRGPICLRRATRADLDRYFMLRCDLRDPLRPPDSSPRAWSDEASRYLARRSGSPTPEVLMAERNGQPLAYAAVESSGDAITMQAGIGSSAVDNELAAEIIRQLVAEVRRNDGRRIEWWLDTRCDRAALLLASAGFRPDSRCAAPPREADVDSPGARKRCWVLEAKAHA